MTILNRWHTALGALTLLALGSITWGQDRIDSSQGSGDLVAQPHFVSTFDKITPIPELPQIFFPNPEEPELGPAVEKIPNSGASMVDIDQGLLQDSRGTVTHAWQDQGNSGQNPADPNMALGPNDLITAVNDDVRFSWRDGTEHFVTDINDWTLNYNVTYFDPKVSYDRLSNRFLIVYMYKKTAATLANSRTGWLLMVSDDNTAQGNWWWYHLDASVNGSTPNSEWADFPYLGYDSNAYCLSANMFPWFESSSNAYAKTRFLRKSEVLTGNGASWWDWVGFSSNGSPDFCICPVPELSNPGELYMINSKSNGGHTLTLRKVTNSNFIGGSPNNYDTDVFSVGNYAPPPDAVQPYGVQGLDTGDTRLGGAIYSFGKIHTTLSTAYDWGGGNTRSTIYMYRITSGPTPTVEWNDGVGSPDLDFFYPQITTTWQDEFRSYITFAVSGNGTYPSVMWGARLNSDPDWSHLSNAKIGTGTSLAIDDEGRNRWGDYFGAAADPRDDQSVALYGLYREPHSWQTWYTRVNHKPSQLVSVLSISTEHSVNTTLSARVTRSDTGANLAGAFVQFQVNGVAVGSASTDATGWAGLAYFVPKQVPSVQTITATCIESYSFNAGSGTGTMTILKHTPLMDVYDRPNYQWKQNALLHAWMHDQNNVGISGATVSFKIGGTPVGSAISDGTGSARLDWLVGVSPGTYIILGEYAGDSYYEATFGSGTLTAIKAVSVLTANDASGPEGSTQNLSATLTRHHDSAPLSGSLVAFRVGGVAVGSAVTNGSGLATVPYAIPGGTLGESTIEANFTGSSLHEPSADTATFTKVANTSISAANASGQRLTTVPLAATLTRSYDGTFLVGRTVGFLVNGVNAGSAVTNGSGVATVNFLIPAGYTPGTHSIFAHFDGDGASYLNPCSASSVLTVQQWASNITMPPLVSGTAGQAVNLLAALWRSFDGAQVPSKSIAFTVEGVGIGSAITNSIGLASLNWTAWIGPLGARPITAAFAGDSDYLPSSQNGTFNRVGKTLGGTVTLLDWTGTRAGKVATVYVYDAGNVLRDSFLVALNSSGVWSKTNSPISTGPHRIEIKVGHWLNRAGINTIGVSNNNAINRSLINGDIDGDNEIGPGDFGSLSAAFGSVTGDGNWNPDADLDGDGEVGPSDFGILSTNFGIAGD